MTRDESEEDRTEAPTPRKIREARKKGQVVVSRDIVASVALLATAAALPILGPGFLDGLRAGVGRSLSGIHEMGIAGAPAALVNTGLSLFASAAPLMILAAAAAGAATLGQVGFLFTGETLQLRGDRLDPIAGLRRAFSMPTFVGIAGGLAKGAIIFGVLAASLWQDRTTLASLSTRDLPEALGIASVSAVGLAGRTALALLALGLIDWAYRRWQHLRDLRMSRREIHDELSEFEGDPAMKDRRRAHYARLDDARQVARVNESVVVVADEREMAVALKLEAGLPVVAAKGRGALADRIREAALAHGIPVLERSDLARALHKRGGAGAPVPAGVRDAAGEAIALAAQMKGTGPRSG